MYTVYRTGKLSLIQFFLMLILKKRFKSKFREKKMPTQDELIKFIHLIRI